jgi:la-related protein 1
LQLAAQPHRRPWSHLRLQRAERVAVHLSGHLNQHCTGELIFAFPPGIPRPPTPLQLESTSPPNPVPHGAMSASTFSYAQAAKGMSTPITASKPTSGSATPAKDGAPATMNGSMGHVPSWADEAEDETLNNQSQPTRDAQPQEASSKPVQQTQSADVSGVSSPEIGASSTSTAIKDDDVASLPNEASDSTWDNKSQASTSVDKSVDGAEKSPEKGKKSKSAPAKPFQEAPLPAVNFWQKRAEEQKAKAPKSNPSLTNGASHVNSGAQAKKSGLDAKARPADSDNRAKGHDEDRPAHGRKDTRADAESKKEAKSRSYDKDAKSTPSTLPPPPNRDQAAWPTPETVIDEDRKKAQEKGDKERKDERKENTVAGSNGKHEWVKVPYIPSVVFSTPLPNTANTRRGGKAGGRGGAQGGGRSTAAGAHGAGQSERDASAPATNGDGDQSKRERADGTAADASPKSKRNGSATSPTLRSQVPASNGEKSFRASGPPASDFEARPRGASLPTDGPHASNHNSAYPRQYPRQNKPRRGEFSGAGERRRDGEGSPTKDNTFDDRRPHTATADGDGERRASAYNDGTSGHQHKQGRFGSYGGGRERGGRGGRGGRGYANGYQHTNGHVAPLQTSNPFTMGPRSPTVFNPEHGAYFAAPQGKYGRSSHRSQSVTTDQYRFPTFQAGQAPAPLQTYGMHDYSQAPMSAQPYAPYVDQFHLFAMITTQL